MAGITRYVIAGNFDGPGAWRFKDARELWPVAIELYRTVFEHLQAPLQLGYEEIEVSKEDFMAGYDRFLGIDAILKFENGMESTLQEKFLFTTFDTVTVEYMDDWRSGIEGDWFKLKAQYYFVGYSKKGELQFDRWVLMNWASMQLSSNQGYIAWKLRSNEHDGAKANFKYTERKKIPEDCKLMDSEYWTSLTTSKQGKLL